MAQYGRPTADTYLGSYTDETGGTTNIYQKISEASASDTDYIRSPVAPANSVYVCKLSSVEDPLSSTGHYVRFRYSKDAAGGAQINLTVELYQDYVDESNPPTSLGTLIATCATLTNIDETWDPTLTYELTPTEANNISAYNNLYLRFKANQV